MEKAKEALPDIGSSRGCCRCRPSRRSRLAPSNQCHHTAHRAPSTREREAGRAKEGLRHIGSSRDSIHCRSRIRNTLLAQST